MRISQFLNFHKLKSVLALGGIEVGLNKLKRIYMKKLLIILCLLQLNQLYGQEVNRRLIYKNGIGLKFGGPTPFLDLNYNHFFNQNINLELGGGAFGGYAGIKYYFGKINKTTAFSPYTGAQITVCPFIMDDFLPVLYVPIGIQFMSKNGFNMNFEVAWFSVSQEWPNGFPWGALSIVRNFK